MAKNFTYGIAASVIAVTIATTGVTTVTSFTFVSEAQAWSIKKAYKKTTRVVKRKANGAYNYGKRGGRHVKKATSSYYKCLTKGCGRIGDLPNKHDHRS